MTCMDSSEMKPIELIHDHLLDRRVLNIVFDSNEKPEYKSKIAKKGSVTATGMSGISSSIMSSTLVLEEYSEQKLLLIAPNVECPATTVATIRTVKQDGLTKVEIDSPLFREMAIPPYAKKWSKDRWRIDLENPASLDQVIEVLKGCTKVYNTFVGIMNSFGSELLSDVMMWNSMEFRKLILQR